MILFPHKQDNLTKGWCADSAEVNDFVLWLWPTPEVMKGAVVVWLFGAVVGVASNSHAEQRHGHVGIALFFTSQPFYYYIAVDFSIFHF